MSDQHRAPDSKTPPPPWEETFVANMLVLRERRRMTQTDLARRLKEFGLAFHQQTIQRIENGERPVRLNEAYLIARVLQYDLDAMTSARVPSEKSLVWTMIRLLDYGLDITDNLHGDIIISWMTGVRQFARDLDAVLIAQSHMTYQGLALVLQAALAFCIKVLETTDSIRKAASDTADFSSQRDLTGAENTYVLPPDETIAKMRNWVDVFDCPELNELAASKSAGWLYRAAKQVSSVALTRESAEDTDGIHEGPVDQA